VLYLAFILPPLSVGMDDGSWKLNAGKWKNLELVLAPSYYTSLDTKTINIM
jgi:uncharacterized membrane protein YqaE (UPF0057 family)